MHLRQPGFTYSICGPFTKTQSLDKALDKVCFQQDMAYGGFKGLPRRMASDKVLRDKAYNIAKNPKYDEYQQGITSIIHKSFGKNNSGGAAKSKIMANQQLAKELHKPIIRKFKKRKIYSSFIENIWGADLGDMQLISKFNKGIRFSIMCYWYLQ